MSKIISGNHITAVSAAATGLLNSSGLPIKKAAAAATGLLDSTGQPINKTSPDLKAIPDKKGKLISLDDKDTDDIIKKIPKEAIDLLNSEKLKNAGFQSADDFVASIREALRRLHADGDKRITVSNWLGTVFEVEGPRHPEAIIITRSATASSLSFANEAVLSGRKVFINGKGKKNTLSKRLLGKAAEIHGLRIGGLKYCDRAFIIRDADGNTLLIVTIEYKARGVKYSDLETQQSARSVRFVDKGRPDTDKLTFFYAGNKELESLDMKSVFLHTENPGNQLGVKALGRNNLEPRFPTGKDDAAGHAMFYYHRIMWPSREVRYLLQQIWNTF